MVIFKVCLIQLDENKLIISHVVMNNKVIDYLYVYLFTRSNSCNVNFYFSDLSWLYSRFCSSVIGVTVTEHGSESSAETDDL